MDEEMEAIISPLPKEKGWFVESMYKYEGFWYEKYVLYASLIIQKSFNPKPETVILATFPKSGTNWFCALLYTTMNRFHYDYSTHPLLTNRPFDCVPLIELQALKDPSNASTTIQNITSLLVSAHIPYKMLPESCCKIVYVCRDPMDVFVSLVHYVQKLRLKELPPLGMDEAFEMFCNGASPAGSYWDHVLGYWKASVEMPNKVCFVKYEDMKRQPIMVLKRVALFIGCPFSFEEEQNGAIQKIVDFCSFENLSSLQKNSDAPSTKQTISLVKDQNNAFFRKGKIGDHKNYLSDEMIKRLRDWKYLLDNKLKRSNNNKPYFSSNVLASFSFHVFVVCFGSKRV